MVGDPKGLGSDTCGHFGHYSLLHGVVHEGSSMNPEMTHTGCEVMGGWDTQ